MTGTETTRRPKVETEHPAYVCAKAVWTRCRDVTSGGDVVKAKGVAYLPALEDQTDRAYKLYKDRADFYEAGVRTVEGLTGALFARDPGVTFPEALKPTLKDVTGAGTPFLGFAKMVLEELWRVGRVGILQDAVGDSPTPRLRWSLVKAEDIVNWRTTTDDEGDEVLTLLVLRETYEIPDAADPFAVKTDVRYRVFTRDAASGAVSVTLWTKTTDERAQSRGEWIAGEAVELTRRGEALERVPFECLNADGTVTLAPSRPPLVGLCDMNLSHYRSSADLERARYYTGSPTPWIAGYTAEPEGPPVQQVEGRRVVTSSPRPQFRIGSAVAWTFDSPDTKVGMLEYSGKGCDALVQACEDKVKMMATLGARLLEAAPSTAETATTVRLRHAGDTSVVKRVAMAADLGLTRALVRHVWWSGLEPAEDGDEAPGVQFDTDFVPMDATPQVVTALMSALQAGTISFKTFYWNLVRANLARPGVDATAELEEIDVDDARFEKTDPLAEAIAAGELPPDAGDPAKGAKDAPPKGGPPRPPRAPR